MKVKDIEIMYAHSAHSPFIESRSARKQQSPLITTLGKGTWRVALITDSKNPFDNTFGTADRG
jgi:hypothetical protein